MVIKKFERRYVFDLICLEFIFSDDEYNSLCFDSVIFEGLENDFECSIFYFIILVGSYKDNDFYLFIIEK